MENNVKDKLENLESKMLLTETDKDVWYIIYRLSETLGNDQELGEYIRMISKKQIKSVLNEKR